jgi:hypothetical protein
LALYTATCMLMAAKYDELDENIPLISDLQRYYTIKVLPSQIEAPTPEEVVECERVLMQRVFTWDLMSVADSLPTHFINYMLANGVLFDNEEGLAGDRYSLTEVAARIADRTLIILDTLVWEKGASKILWGQ